MRIHGGLRLARGRSAALLLAVLLSACGSMNVVSEGGDANLMLHGYDPVAYFTQGRATPGDPAIKAEYRGVAYRFASEEDRRQFITSPERYAPQFGGFCAQQMAYAIPDAAGGEIFKIIDGRLYVFRSARARLYFEMDHERNLRLAQGYWESEVRDGNRHFQFWRRQLVRVPGYKTDAELADEYARRFSKAPG